MTERSTIIKRIHIAVLIIGALLFLSTSFSGNIWFDECYSEAVVSHSVSDIPSILLDDVHPFLYYILLKAVSLVTGGSFIALKLFSVLGMWTLVLTGYTHVRRYFGERIGLFFSVFAAVSPASIKYSGEIRMYSWAAVFVFFAALYAYLSVRDNFKSHRHAVLFVIFSVAAAYMHYYGLATVCVINAFVIVAVIVRRARIKPLIVCAVSELVLYIPGFIIFLIQSSRVAASGYWIRVKYPDVILQTMSYAVTGGDSYWDVYMPLIFFGIVAGVACILFVISAAVIHKWAIKRRGCDTNAVPAALALGVFVSVVACGLIISVFKDFYYVRYSMLVHGLLIFAYAFAASKIKRGWLMLSVVLSTVFCVVSVMVPYYTALYNGDSDRAKAELNEAFSDEDVLVYDALTPGSVITHMLPHAEQYFYNPTMDEYPRAYTAFEPTLKTVNDTALLPDVIDGQLWVMVDEWGSESFMKSLREEYPSLSIEGEFNISIKYRNNIYRFFVCNING